VKEEDVSLKDIILRIQYWFSIIKPKLTWIISISLLFGFCAALNVKYVQKPSYEASYHLIFNEGGDKMTGAMRLASSFGLSLGAGNASVLIPVKNFLISRLNISEALDKSISGTNLITRYLQDDLENDRDFQKKYTSSFGMDKRYSDSLITEVRINLLENNILVFEDLENGIVDFSVTGSDEFFVFHLSEQLIKNTEEYFIRLKKEKSFSAVQAFEEKVDSLEQAIDFKLLELGQYQDQNTSLVNSVDKMKQLRLSIDLEALKVSYGEYIKGLEMSKVELMNSESPFTYFDFPTYPLVKDKESALKWAIIISLLNGGLMVLFFILRIEIKNILS